MFMVDDYELMTFYILEGLCPCCEMFRTMMADAAHRFELSSGFEDVRKAVEELEVGTWKDVPRFTNLFGLAVQWAKSEAELEIARKMSEAVEEAEAHARQGRPMQGRNMGGKGSKGNQGKDHGSKGAGKQGDDASSLDQMD